MRLRSEPTHHRHVCSAAERRERAPGRGSEPGHARNDVPQKKPKRSPAAVTKATGLSIVGYQGKSTTKGVAPRKPRAPLVQQKTPKRSAHAVRKATALSIVGYQGKSTTKGKQRR